MVDTVCFSRTYSINPNYVTAPASPSGWSHSRKGGQAPNGFQYQRHTFVHESSGLRLMLQGSPKVGKRQKFTVEVSLSRLLFGDNARLITSQPQLDRALRQAHALVSQVAGQPKIKFAGQTAPYSGISFKRVDLCWQIKGRMHDFILAHRDMKHPEIHSLPEIYGQETIRWAGSGPDPV